MSLREAIPRTDVQTEYLGLPEFNPVQGWHGKGNGDLSLVDLKGNAGSLSRWSSMQEHDLDLDELNDIFESANKHPGHGIQVNSVYDSAVRNHRRTLADINGFDDVPHELLKSMETDAETLHGIVKGRYSERIMELDLLLRSACNWVVLGDGFDIDTMPGGKIRAAQLRGLKLSSHKKCGDPIGRPVLRGRDGKLAVWSGQAAIFLGIQYEA
jgi:hypothetical protein